MSSGRADDHILLSEADHRIKNSLQLIAGLLHNQAKAHRSGPLANVLGETYGRIMAVARLHELLSRTPDAEFIAVDDYLTTLSVELGTALSDPRRHTILVNADGVLLTAQTTMTLGLIVHELVTNALKHASTHKPVVVTIDCGLDGDGDLVLEVGHTGGSIFADLEDGSNGLGLRLVHTLIQQLNGRLEHDMRPPRPCQRVIVPVQTSPITRKAS